MVPVWLIVSWRLFTCLTRIALTVQLHCCKTAFYHATPAAKELVLHTYVDTHITRTQTYARTNFHYAEN